MRAPHWRARLAEIQDLVIQAMADEQGKSTADAIGQALIHLTAVLQDEWPLVEHPAVQLVREAFDLLQNPESRVNARDWLKAAALYVAPDTVIGRPVLQRTEDA